MLLKWQWRSIRQWGDELSIEALTSPFGRILLIHQLKAATTNMRSHHVDLFGKSQYKC